MKKIFVLIILTFFFLFANSQFVKRDSTFFQPKIKLTFTPHHLIYNCLKLNVEKELKNNDWLDIPIEMYYGRRMSNSENVTTRSNYYDNLYGLGIGANYKHFFPFYNMKNLYFSVGGMYHFFFLNYKSSIWQIEIVNGTQQYHLNEVDVYEQINRFNANINVGIETEMYEKIYFDMFFGLGQRYSLPFYNFEISENKFDQTMWAYGYSGTVIFIGMRIGLLYKNFD